jgi:pSer/pThr/pTyr-binding forkhead associated (FHA) protein
MFGVLEVIQGPGQGQTFQVGKHTVALGRDPDRLGVAGIRIADPCVSRLHCSLEWQGERLLVSDAGSAGGTWVNGERLSAPRELQPGDVLSVGDTALLFRWSRDDERPTAPWPSRESDQS